MSRYQNDKNKNICKMLLQRLVQGINRSRYQKWISKEIKHKHMKENSKKNEFKLDMRFSQFIEIYERNCLARLKYKYKCNKELFN